VQSKIAFARLPDELGAPQPRWWPVQDDTVPGQIPYPHFLKSAFSTAGQGVRQDENPQTRPPDTYDLWALPAAAGSACPTRLAGAQNAQIWRTAAVRAAPYRAG
jgi:hypothetical protein